MKMKKSKIREAYENCVVALLWVMCWLLSIQPRFIRYGLYVPFVAFIMGRVANYRKAVVMKQLRDSFPTKSEAEINEISRRYYRHLAELVIGTLSLAGMGERRCRKTNEFSFPENFHETIEGKNIVVLSSHYGFWEVAINLYLAVSTHYVVGAYRPLKSPIMEKLYKKLRSVPGVDVVPSHLIMRHIVANRNGIDGKNLVIGLIADQNCPPTKDCCWHNFLNHDSLFFDGGEQLAKKFGMPVFYMELERVSAGCYRHKYTLLYDGVEEVRPHEITERYVRCLERTIEANPEYWVWSHKRWKNSPKAGAQFYDNYKTME